MALPPQDFVSKWKRVRAREKQTYQDHFIDLCHLVGHATPNEYDPTGTCFAFEMGATKTSGGRGRADVAKLGYLRWEYKAKDDNLDKAYDQLLRYRDSLNKPPLLIVSDISNIIIRTNYTNLPTRTITLTFDDVLTPAGSRPSKLYLPTPSSSNRSRRSKASRVGLPHALPGWPITCASMAMNRRSSPIF